MYLRAIAARRGVVKTTFFRECADLRQTNSTIHVR